MEQEREKQEREKQKKQKKIQSDFPVCPDEEEQRAEERTREAAERAAGIKWGDHEEKQD